ncbi:MAG: prepilin peptidase, partial [Phycisphaerales bacterium]|nr:prepilin peptidase [Phycisphaerales bacterium]
MSADTQLLLIRLVPVIFIFCFGACVGSLMNVLVYRLPLGQGVVTEPSHCPRCNTRLTWRENIPIFGWLFLRGRCRFCKAPISPQYPLVEFAVAMLFVLLWLQLYFIPNGAHWFGLPIDRLTPNWARSGGSDWTYTWPIFAVVALLFAGLLASTIIDARTFTIPLQIPWACTLIGVVVHTAWAAVIARWQHSLPSVAPGALWSFSTPQAWPFPSGMLGVPPDVDTSGVWWWIGVALGATAGLGLSCLMLRLGWIRRSMDDYEQWESEELARQARLAADPAAKADAKLVPIDTDTGLPADPTELWTLYPRARREMVKELAFLAAPVLLAIILGAVLFRLNYAEPPLAPTAPPQVIDGGRLVPFRFAMLKHAPPLWLVVLAGSLLGYLIVGGVLWAVRILGTLGFGKEAMGMGDVHLMAAVGACLGWIDGTLAFFLSAPVALAGWLVGWVIARLGGSGGTLPRGCPGLDGVQKAHCANHGHGESFT